MTNKFSIVALAALLLSLAVQPPIASAADVVQTISGPAYTTDGDTIVVGQVRVRLNGVDAPEVAHLRHPSDDPFGPESRDEMRSIIGDQVVRCELNGERSYERVIGVCYLPDGTDIGAEIIRRGLALDCPHFSGGRYRA